MNKLTLEEAAGVYSGTAHDAKPHPMHIERNKAFKAGSEWQRNHVWHKPTEQPEESKLVLILTPYCAYICGPCHKDWEGTVDHFKITTWVYVDDLKTTSFGETLEADKGILKGDEE